MGILTGFVGTTRRKKIRENCERGKSLTGQGKIEPDTSMKSSILTCYLLAILSSLEHTPFALLIKHRLGIFPSPFLLQASLSRESSCALRF